MRAERDDDEVRIVRKAPERRLAYEIAIGIIIGGTVLSLIQQAGDSYWLKSWCTRYK
jgi:hypothetical protein